jgi:hypothetical protein
MLYSEVEKYLLNEDMEGLLTELAPVFTEVRYICDGFIDSSIYNSGEAVKSNLSKLTSYYSTLKVASIVVDTFKSRKDASAFVEAERRVRNIIDAYIDIAQNGIGISQSILKYISEEIRMSK